MSLMDSHRQLVPEERGGLLKRHAFVVGSLIDEVVGQVDTMGAQVTKAVESHGDKGVIDRFRPLIVMAVLLFLSDEGRGAELLGFLIAISGQELVLDGEVDESALDSEAGDSLFEDDVSSVSWGDDAIVVSE